MAGAVTASTLTTVAVFAPIALVGGLVGQIFSSFAITVTVALLASLFVALTVVPVLAYWFLKPAGRRRRHRGDPPGGRGEGAAQPAAARLPAGDPVRHHAPLDHRADRGADPRSAPSALGTQLKTNFLDQSGQDTLSDHPDAAGRHQPGRHRTTRPSRSRPCSPGRSDVKTYQVTVGNGDFNPFAGSSGASTASFQVALAEKADAAKVTDQLRAKFDAMSGIGEVKIGATTPGSAAASSRSTSRPPTPDVLAAATEQVRQAMAGVGGVTDVGTTLAASVPRLDVVVKRDVAARDGLTEASIGQSVAGGLPVRAGRAGHVDGATAGRGDLVRYGAGRPGRARGAADHHAQRPRSGSTRSPTSSRWPGPSRSPGSTATAAPRSPARRPAPTSARRPRTLTTKLKALTLPAGASYTVGGVSADQADAFQQLGLAVLAAIAIVFIIMVATFRSLIQPVILLVSIPFAATGAIVLLLVTGTPLGVPSLIGVLMLVGIVVTNAIVLMDLINHYRLQGMGVQEAVIEGGRHRLRPILMTAIATIFALLPMALGLTGEGGFISQPLAIVVIGGLVSSTLLTLVLVPTLYTMVENRKERWRAGRRARSTGRGVGEARLATESDGGFIIPGEPVPASSGAQEASVSGQQPIRGAQEASVSGQQSSRGAQDPPASGQQPSSALRGYTDQFEVLRMPRRPAGPPPAGQ